MREGWICLHRSLVDHWLWSHPQYLQAWIMILLMANHQPRQVAIKGRVYNVPRGASCRSVATWVRLLNGDGRLVENSPRGLSKTPPWWTPRKFRIFINLLEASRMVSRKTDNCTTMLTVLNYETYQGRRHADDHAPRHALRHAGVTQASTNNNDNKDNKEEGGNGRTGTVGAPPTPAAVIDDENQKRSVVRQGATESDDLPARDSRGVPELRALYGARVRDDRTDWEAAIRTYGWDHVAAHCARVMASGEAVWLSRVLASIHDQPTGEPKRDWRRTAIDQLMGACIHDQRIARACVRAIEAHAGQSIRDDLRPAERELRLATYVVNHCTDLVDDLIREGVVPSRDAASTT